MTESRKRTLTSGAIDIVLFAIFMALTDPRLTGIALHEWGSIGMAAIVIIHLVRNLAWIQTMFSRTLQSPLFTNKLSVVLNILLFIVFALLIYSGIAISRETMPFLGIAVFENRAWRFLHGLLSHLTVVIVALHTALHWNWIVSLFRRTHHDGEVRA
ncbi:MAG: DUF4405 domain-containing protein [Roseiflexaceae bacterium]|jgi:hypothetical protein